MRLNRRHLEMLAISALYLFSLFFWTLPLQGNPLPFGDVDASSHFVIGDVMVERDTSITQVPYHVFQRYGGQNSALPGYLWYPPQYWTNLGIAQILGGDRTLAPLLFVAIFSSLIVLSSYFLIRSLFGFWPAFLSSFLLIFSVRDYMIYLWGQWPQSLSFAFTPLVLYCFYKITEEKPDTKKALLYFLMLASFLAAQFLFHPQGLIASLGACLVFTVFLLAKERRLPFSIKQALLAALVFAVMGVSFAPLNIGEFFIELSTPSDSPSEDAQYQKLFQWYQGIEDDPGLPDFYFTYNLTHGSPDGGLLSWWTLPLLLIGIITLSLRREKKDLLLLAWLVSFYILTRLVVFGIGQRDIRMFAYEAHVFYPIIAIGLIAIPALLLNQENIKRYVKAGLITLFLVLGVFVNGVAAYDTLSGMQQSLGRITPPQYEAAQWVQENLPEKAHIYAIGTLGYQNFGGKVKWLGVLSQHRFATNPELARGAEFIFMDLSDARYLGNEDYVRVLQQIESQFANLTPLYDRNSIRIYQVKDYAR